MRFLLAPMSHRPDQPAIAAPNLKMRDEPRKKGSAKDSIVPKGTVSESCAERM